MVNQTGVQVIWSQAVRRRRNTRDSEKLADENRITQPKTTNNTMTAVGSSSFFTPTRLERFKRFSVRQPTAVETPARQAKGGGRRDEIR